MTPGSPGLKQSRRRHSPCRCTFLAHSLSASLPSSQWPTSPTLLSPPLAEAARDELVERLKADLAAKTEQMTRGQRARVRVRGARSAIASRPGSRRPSSSCASLSTTRSTTSTRAPRSRRTWRRSACGRQEYADKADLASAGRARRGLVRGLQGHQAPARPGQRERGSAAETLANTMKQNEELAEKNSKLQRDYDDALTSAWRSGKRASRRCRRSSRALGSCRRSLSSPRSALARGQPAAPRPAVSAPPRRRSSTVKAEASKAAQAVGAPKANPLE